MRVLVVGSGGREHCLAWKIGLSPEVDRVFCAPGNAGTSSVAENVPIQADNIPALRDFAARQKIGLTVVGPENTLASGIADSFSEAGLRVFGPTKAAAEIESSKVFCRELLKKESVPQPDYKVFESAEEAIAFVKNSDGRVVVKADGLASGKGVTVCNSVEEAVQAVNAAMVEKVFGEAGSKILVEERLSGQEASFMCFVDGKNIVPLAPAQDHKRAFDNDFGPNTGGMGAFSPTPVLDFELEKRVLQEIVKPTVYGLEKNEREFKGLLYAGLMVSGGKPKLVEFNCRFGDPETQAVLPRLKTDILDPLLGSVEGNLNRIQLDWKSLASTCVVLASNGYPGKYETGKQVFGLDIVKAQLNSIVFHAGTKTLNGKFFSNGGRVLNVVGLGESLKDSVLNAYNAVKKIRFEGMHYRKDIAAKAVW